MKRRVSQKFAPPAPVMPRRNRLLCTSAMSALALVVPLMAPVVVQAQTAIPASYQATPTVTSGGAVITTAPNITNVNVTGAQTVIRWTPDNSPNANGVVVFQDVGATTTYSSTLQSYTVLNRIIQNTGINPMSFAGTTNSGPGGKIWFFTPGGLILSSTARFNVGSLVLSTSDIDQNFGSGTPINFTATPLATSAIDIQAGAQINALSAGSYVALVAPRIVQAGNVDVNGSVAYIAAEAATLTFGGNGLFDIQVTTGTGDANGIVHSGTTTGAAETNVNAARGIYMMAIPKSTALTMLLGGTTGYRSASSAVLAHNGTITLGAGYDSSSTPVDPDKVANIAFGPSTLSSDLTARATGTVTANITSGKLLASMSTAGASPQSVPIIMDLQGLGGVSVAASGTGKVDVAGVLSLASQDLYDVFAPSPYVRKAGNVSLSATGGGTVSVGSELRLLTVNSHGTSNVIAQPPVPQASDTVGNVTVNVAGQGSALTVGGTTQIDASILAYDTLGFSNARGGNVTVNVNGGGTASLGAATINAGANGFSGNLSSSPALQAIGGNGTGGTISVEVDAPSSLTARSFTADASGRGGTGTAQGGNGVGGTILVTNNGIMTFGLVGAATNQQNLALTAAGIGGASPVFSNATTANGGNGTGGTITVLNQSGGRFTLNGSGGLFAGARNGFGRGTGTDGRATGSVGGISIASNGANSILSSTGGVSINAGSTATLNSNSTSDTRGGTIGITAANGGSLTVGGYLSAGASASAGGSPTSAGSVTGGAITVSAVGGSVTTGGMGLTVDAISNISAATGALAATAGTIQVFAQNQGPAKGTIRSTGFNSFSADARGGSGVDGSDATGGTIDIYAQEGTINLSGVDGQLNDTVVSATGLAGFANGGSAGSGTGGKITVETRAASANSTLSSVISVDNLSASSFGTNLEFSEGVFGDGSGGAGTGGEIKFNILGGALNANSLSISSTGQGGSAAATLLAQPAIVAGLGKGGNVTLLVDGGNLTIARALSVASTGIGGFAENGSLGSGTQAGVAGNGLGGAVDVTVKSGSLSAGSITILSSGEGGTPGARGAGTTTPRGGNGTGGDATLSIQGNGAVTSASLKITSSGVGGSQFADPGSSFSFGPVGGYSKTDGGDGQGGTAAANLIGGTATIGDFEVRSGGTGGRGTGISSTDGGIGGAGMGGEANFLLTGTATTITDLTVASTGFGGIGGSSGRYFFSGGGEGFGGLEDFTFDPGDGTGGLGGTGIGGKTNVKFGVDPVIANLTVDTSGIGAAGGDGAIGGVGGDGVGGSGVTNGANLTLSNDTLQVTGSLTLRSDGTGGDGGTGAEGRGGDGGNGVAGDVRLIVDGAAGPTLLLVQKVTSVGANPTMTLSAAGTGGDGGSGTIDNDAFDGTDGGSGTGGSIEFITRNGGTATISGNLTVNASGSGGGAEFGAANSLGAGAGGDGGDGIGGSVTILTETGGTITLNQSATFDASGAGGSGTRGSNSLSASVTSGKGGDGGDGLGGEVTLSGLTLNDTDNGSNIFEVLANGVGQDGENAGSAFGAGMRGNGGNGGNTRGGLIDVSVNAVEDVANLSLDSSAIAGSGGTGATGGTGGGASTAGRSNKLTIAATDAFIASIYQDSSVIAGSAGASITGTSANGKTALGGDATFTLSSGDLEVANILLDASAHGGAGSNGGSADGGNTSVTVSGGNLRAHILSLTSSGYGGSAFASSTGNGGIGGLARGGISQLQVSLLGRLGLFPITVASSTIQSGQVFLQARGFGGRGGDANGNGSGGAGGTGIGGTVSVDLGNYVPLNADSPGDIDILVFAQGGQGGSAFGTGVGAGSGGAGGNATGGTATLSSSGAQTSLGIVSIDSASQGGAGGNGGSAGGQGGDATGGEAAIFVTGSTATFTLANLNALRADAVGGKGGDGGNLASGGGTAGIGGEGGQAIGGTASIKIADGATADILIRSGFSASAFGGEGGRGGSSFSGGGAGGVGGEGGLAVGGLAEVEVNAAQLTLNNFVGGASATGGEGGQGGRGSAGLSPTGSAAGGSNGSNGIAPGSSGTAGGAGGTGADGLAGGAGANGGAGGEARGGTVRIAAIDTTLNTGAITAVINGTGGIGGRGGNGGGGGNGQTGGNGGFGGNGVNGANGSPPLPGPPPVPGGPGGAGGNGGSGGAGGNGGNGGAGGAAGNAGFSGIGTGGQFSLVSDGGDIVAGTITANVSGIGGGFADAGAVGVGGAGGGAGLGGVGGTRGLGGTGTPPGANGTAGSAGPGGNAGSGGDFGNFGFGTIGFGFGGGISIEARNDGTLSAALTSLTSSASFVSGGTYGIGGNVLISNTNTDPTKAISFAGLDITTEGDFGSSTGRGVTIDAGGGGINIKGNANIISADSVVINASGQGQLLADGNLSAQAGSQIVVTHEARPTGLDTILATTVTLTSANEINGGAGSRIRSRTGLQLLSNGTITSDGDLNSVDRILVQTLGHVSLFNATTTSTATGGANIDVFSGYQLDTGTPIYDNFQTTVTGALSATGQININSGGSTNALTGASFTSGGSTSIYTGDNLTAADGVTFISGGDIDLQAGRFSALSIPASEVASLILGNGTLTATGGTISLSGEAIDAGTATFNSANFRASIINAPGTGTPGGDDGELLTGPDCVEGNICLGGITAANSITIRDANQVHLRQDVGADRISITSRDRFTSQPGKSITGTTSLDIIVTNGDLDLLDDSESTTTLNSASIRLYAGGSINGALASLDANEVALGGGNIFLNSLTTGSALKTFGENDGSYGITDANVLNASGTVSINSLTVNGNNANINAGSISLGDATADGINLTAVDSIGVGSGFAIDGSFLADSLGAVTLDTIDAAQSIGVRGSNVIGATWTAGEDVQVLANGDVAFGNGAIVLGSVTAGDDIEISGGSISLTTGNATGLGPDGREVDFSGILGNIGFLSGGSGDAANIVLSATEAITAGNLTAPDDIDLIAGTTVTVTGTLRTTGDTSAIAGDNNIYVEGGDAVHINAANAFSTFGAFGGSFDSTGSVTAGTYIDIIATGDITATGLISATGPLGRSGHQDIFLESISGTVNVASLNAVNDIFIDGEAITATGTITSGTSTTLYGNSNQSVTVNAAKTGTDFEIFTTGMAIVGTVTAGDDIHLEGDAGVVANGLLRTTGTGRGTSDSDIVLTTDGSVRVASVDAFSDIESLSGATSFIATGALIAGEDLEVSVTGATTTGAITAGDDILISGGVVTLGALTTNTSGPDDEADGHRISVNGTSVNLSSASSAGNIALTAATGITTGNLTANAGNVVLTNPVGTIKTGLITVANDFTLNTPSILDLGGVSAGDDVRLTSAGTVKTGSLTARGDGTDNEGDQANIVVTGTSLDLGNSDAVTGGITLRSTTGNLTTANQTAQRNISNNSAGLLTTGNTLSRAGDISLISANAMLTGNHDALTGSVFIENTSGTITAGVITLKNDFTLNTNSNIFLGGVTAGDDVRINTSGNAALGTLGSTGNGIDNDSDGSNIVLTVGGNLTVTHAEAKRNFTATATRFETGLNSIITGGDISINTTGDIALGNSTAGGFIFAQAIGGNVTFNALSAGTFTDLRAYQRATGTGSITGGSSVSSDYFAADAANGIAITNINSGSFATARNQSGAVSLGTVTAGSNIFVLNYGTDLTSATTLSTDGDISVTAFGDMTIGNATARGTYLFDPTDPTSAADGNISLLSYANTTLGTATARTNLGVVGYNRNGPSSVTGTGTWTAGEDLLVISTGTATLGTLSAGDNLSVTAPGGISIVSATAGATGRDNRTFYFDTNDGERFAVTDPTSADGSDILLSATNGDISATNLTAGDDIHIDASGAVTLGTIMASGDGVSDGDGGASILITSGGGTLVTHAEADDDFTVTAARFETGLNTIITGGDIDITTVGDALLGNSTAGGFIRVNAGGLINFNNIQSGTTTGLFAATTLAGTQSIAGGAFTGNGNAGVQIGSVNSVGGAFSTTFSGPLAIGSVITTGDIFLRGGSGGVAVTTATAGGDVNIVSSAAASIANATASGTYVDRNGGTREGNIFVIAAGNASLGNATAARMIGITGANITGSGAWSAGEDVLASTKGSSTLGSVTAGDDVTIIADAGLTIANATAAATGNDLRKLTLFTGEGTSFQIDPEAANGSDVSLTSVNGAVNATNVTAGDDVLISAGGNVSITGLARSLGVGTTGGASNIGIAGVNVSVANANAFSGLSIGATGTAGYTALTSGTSTLITAGGAITGGTANAGTTLTLTGPSIAVGNSSAGGLLSLTSTTGAIGGGTLSGGGVAINSATTLNAGAIAATNGNINIQTTGVMTTGNLTALLGSVFLQNTLGLITTGIITARDDFTLLTGSDINFAGIFVGDDIRITTGGTATLGTLTTTGLGTDNESDGSNIVLSSTGAMTVTHAEAKKNFTATASRFETGLNTIITGGDIDISTGGDALIGNSQAGGFIRVNAAGLIDFNNIQSGIQTSLTAVNSITGAQSMAGGTFIARAGSGIQVGSINSVDGAFASTNTGLLSIGSVVTTGDIDLRSRGTGGMAVTTATAGGDIFLISNAAATVANATASGTYVDRNGGTRDGNIFLVAGGNANLTNASAARMIGVTGANIASTGTWTAGEDILAMTGGTAALNSVTAGDDVAIIAAGGITVANATASATGNDLRKLTLFTGEGTSFSVSPEAANGSDVTLTSTGGAIGATNVTAGDDITINAGGAVNITSLARTRGVGTTGGASNIEINAASLALANANAATDLLVTTSGNAGIASGVAGRDIIINSGSVSLGSAMAGRDVTANALSGNATATGTVSAARNARVTGRSVTLATVTAGTDATLNATAGPLGYTSVTAGNNATLSATANISGGAVTATAGNASLASSGGGIAATGAVSAGTDVTLSAAAPISYTSIIGNRNVGITAPASLTGGGITATTGAINFSTQSTDIGQLTAGITITGTTTAMARMTGATAGGAFSLNAGATNLGIIDAGSIVIASGQGVIFNQLLSRGTTTLNAGDDVAGALIQSTGALIANAGRNVSVTTINGGSSITVATKGFNSSTVTAGSNIDIVSSGDISLGNTSAGGYIDARTSKGGIDFGALVSGTSTTLGARTGGEGSGQISGNTIAAGVNVAIDAETRVNYATITANRDARIVAGGAVVGGNITATTGAISFTAQSATIGQLTAGTTITGTTTGLTKMTGATAGGAVTINAGNTDLGTVRGATITVTSALGVIFSQLISTGATSLTAGTDILGMLIDADGALTMTAGRNINVTNLDVGTVTSTATGTTTVGSLKTTGNGSLTSNGGVTLASTAVTGNLTLGASGGNVAVTNDLRATGLVNATGNAVNLVSQGSFTIGNATASSGPLTATAAGALAVNGIATGPTIIFRSADIAIDPTNGRVGTQGTTTSLRLENNGGRQTYIGGNGGTGTYGLSGAEAQRLFAGDVTIIAPRVGNNSGSTGQTGQALTTRTPDVILDALTLTGTNGQTGATAGNIGTSGSFNIETPGKLRTVGAVRFNNLTSGNRFNIIASEMLEVDPSTGSIALRNSTGGLAGRINLTSDDVIAASSSAISDVIAAVDVKAINDRLSRNDGAVNDDGVFSAEGMTVNVRNGFYVQNTGTTSTNPRSGFDLRRGFTVGTGGLTINATSATTRIVINGRQSDATGGFITGLKLIPIVTIAGQSTTSGTQTGLFDIDSTINGCAILRPASCQVSFDQIGITRDTINDIRAGEGAGGEGSLLPIALIQLKDVEGFDDQPIIDDPVTGSGNDDLWSVDDDENCPADDATCAKP